MNAKLQHTQAKLSLKFGGCSLKGRREENQDAFIVNAPDNLEELTHKGVVASIADGVSCSNVSQQASHIATTQFVTDYFATPDSWSTRHAAGSIIKTLNRWLFEQGEKQALTHNSLVTTFSSVIFKSNTAHIFHVGDSRIYRIRDNQIHLLTRDHQRTNFGQAAYLTRALGMDNTLEVDYQSVSLQVGDRFILTTDGVHDHMEQEVLQRLASTVQIQDFEALSQTICEQALTNQSPDNVSCLIVEVTELPGHSLLEHQQLTLQRSIPPALRVAQKIDDYRIEKVLFAGTRSHVYLVTEETSGKQMVLKAPSPFYADDIEFLTHFSNEYWIGSQLDSDRVMRMYPKPRQSKFVYQLCEYIDGINLRQWMYDNPTPSLASVRTILDKLIKAVRVLQRADMVHRDLKPENVMLTTDGSIKIIDLGAVQVQGLEEISPEKSDDTPLGAINYTAPETINHGEATICSDLFSVAVIGYEMLAGELPYKATSGQNVQNARHMKWDYRPLKQYRDDIPEWVDLVFQKGVHHLPAKRYDVLSEFVSDLYTPNKALQKELEEKPLLERNPVAFWKAVALIAITIAVVEFLVMVG
ncbi:bifunctional protein-serine/threonine kinase/phosphatase [Vibrio sp. SCSIO 43136]|uniref:bifunctional protein-serine/threonine kinase/phosphatase n=1 Tax=Vibrio sp. SCSIO 43136 TaxID=2819101 RepID=UPI00207550CD|nr:bifunctional protein-serine/threonine kinase/phosphatase [Vibrio sp. SCSIO 43136]USD67562.1 bifunctional protein-serine/threonine kinase/phosphatase [Vibrio sp. SCSIO 43136]